MRLIGVFIVVAGLGSACVPGNSPIRIVDFLPVDTSKCTAADMNTIESGRLDASGAGVYLVGVSVDSDLAKVTQLDSTGAPISGPGANNFVVEFAAMTYTAKDAMSGATVGGAFAPEQVPLSAVIPPASTKNELVLSIIGPKAAARLVTTVTPMNPVVILSVGVTLKGHVESGASLSSNTLTFPITVTTTNASCANGFSKSAPCAEPGQDSTPVTCL
jgi:hypothetical protein